MNNGFAFVKKSTMRTKTFHSYTATKDTCMASSPTAEITQGSVTRYKEVSTASEYILMSAATRQSVYATIERDQFPF